MKMQQSLTVLSFFLEFISSSMLLFHQELAVIHQKSAICNIITRVLILLISDFNKTARQCEGNLPVERCIAKLLLYCKIILSSFSQTHTQYIMNVADLKTCEF